MLDCLLDCDDGRMGDPLALNLGLDRDDETPVHRARQGGCTASLLAVVCQLGNRDVLESIGHDLVSCNAPETGFSLQNEPVS